MASTTPNTLGHNKPCPYCLANLFSFSDETAITATSLFPLGRSNFWNQCKALQLSAVCSNALVQAIAVALFAGSVAAGFLICICPKDGFPKVGDCLVAGGLRRLYHPVSVH
ncbi:hypothetical protein VF14_06120 [Nostoc linckia z18]|uniref:Uncharacterized protein n=2 Tax=Nostoc linckia TaxID=92942 RepID=A0A9Q5ZEB1_NOSLI|nr:hypothetical protein [Nostoc linckia]PHJ66029.1 hypothetical protein VF02_09325 [Nostoc linckia z1]PHJ68936.1 hypothetical protein VF05_14960 [Nostoc linckia z3]PHJ74587.1 hypothetical protein VF03_13785 [Nostoc linckia z2]PHJ87088.1 hypothetical protein VF06_01945 [Nostoc linckia z4]PHJ88255.1 hypothetical protein VF07_17370 [Nostoc linckia z6]PHJ93199.1 hypothetical protein VF04_26875 [Nostoc linckia z7]PHK07901.1 hypothetical protein VF09_22420 [Nostoc linckia z9]PHK18426.1 hypothetic